MIEGTTWDLSSVVLVVAVVVIAVVVSGGWLDG